MDQNLPTIQLIQAIADSYARDWEKQRLGFARELLSRTWGGIPLPTLSVCGRGTQEIRYSTYLGYFLDVSKPHGLGSRYLDQLLAFVGHDDIDTFKCVTETEKWLGEATDARGTVSCFCDIVISTDHYCILIEQKIKSAESNNPNSMTSQLARYDQAIEGNSEFDNKAIIRLFLTPTGKLSSKSPNWQSISYTDLVRVGLKTLKSGGLSGIARENLKRCLLDLLLGPFEKAETEIQSLIDYAEKAVWSKNFSDRLRFDQLASNNSLMVEILMEG